MTTDFLLDTNVLSEAARPRPDAGVLAWTRSLAKSQTWISVVTLAELANGIDVAPASKQVVLRPWLEEDVRDFYREQIVSIDESVLRRALTLATVGRREGRGHSLPDLLIAATALVHNMTVATRNVRDFLPFGVLISNPWSN